MCPSGSPFVSLPLRMLSNETNAQLETRAALKFRLAEEKHMQMAQGREKSALTFDFFVQDGALEFLLAWKIYTR